MEGLSFAPGPLSDDGDALVADLLSQFNAGKENPRPSFFSQYDASDVVAPAPHSPPPGPLETVDIPSEPQFVGVEIPALDELEDYEYEYLPGHFDVQRVISETSSPTSVTLYRVKLRSGEKVDVPFARLKKLNNGLRALEQFHQLAEQPQRRRTTRMAGEGGPRLRITLNVTDASSSDEDYSAVEEEEESSSSALESSSADEVLPLRRLRPRRRTRAQVSTLRHGNEPPADSESSDDIISAAFKSRYPQRTTSRKLRSRRTLSDSGDEFPVLTGRRSTRARKSVRRNLRERLEDEISEHEEPRKKEKFVGARETFQSIPVDDPFRQRHRDTCEVCKITGDSPYNGPMVFCQGCTSAYHQACLGPRTTRDHLVTKVAEDQFILQCRRCIGIAHAKNPMNPHLGCCTVCNEAGPMSEPLRARLTSKQEQQLRQRNGGKDPVTSIDMNHVNNVANVLFRCHSCQRAFHFEHLPPKSEIDQDPDSVDQDVARFTEYSGDWSCYDCDSAAGHIGAIVAWRPTDPKNYIPAFTADTLEEVDKEYLIKWKEKSYFHVTWMAGSWVYGVASTHMRRAFFRSEKNERPCMTTDEAIPEDFLRIDVVLDVRFSTGNDNIDDSDLARVKDIQEVYVKFRGLQYEDAVWDVPPSPLETDRYNDFLTAYQDWVAREYIRVPKQDALRRRLADIRKEDFKTLVRDTQPELMTGGVVKDFQLDGLNWLYYMWFTRQNAILADEMGLGKTIQVIGLLATLIHNHECWPFLVVVPNSTCPNWKREIKSWAPSIRVATYYGSSQARQLALNYEMFPRNSHDLRCHVVISSYETMIDPVSKASLAKVPWQGLIVDEGQRLKNSKSQIYESLARLKVPFKVLMTGTPLQNNVRELLNLIQFCDPTKDAETLERDFSALSKDNIATLHEMLRPFFLRRTKAQVLDLPSMVRIIVPVSMSVLQKRLYKSILAKNPELIKAIFQKNHDRLKQAERQNLNNILMQLRKCLCHPFMYSRAIEERTTNHVASHRHLVEASGKLQLLELMLPKLHERGHRVLIFSQYLDNLDIVEDFLFGLGLQHRRLDGSMTSLEKQKQIDAFNAEGSPYFAFLLSTRSGGVGINLATADTVIIMDPDFNPHQDMQALSRAHRMGQKNKVLVLQLMTRNSVEEKIFQIGQKKMMLDHVLIDRMDADDDDGVDLESILRHGAQALFDNDDSGDVQYDAETVDKLLDRSQVEQEAPDRGESTFSFARVWTDEGTLEERLSDPDKDVDTPISSTVWEKILREREQLAAEEARRRHEALGRGKRKRTAVDYTTVDGDADAGDADAGDAGPMKIRRASESDEEFNAGVEDASSESEPELELDPEELVAPQEPPPPKQRTFERMQPPTPPSTVPPMSMDGAADPLPCLACEGYHATGSCPLKLAGVEHCGLCGIAHFGHSRACPYLRDEDHVIRMLEALKQSPEPRHLVAEAKKYLRSIRHDFAQRRRRDLIKANGGVAPPPRPRGRPSLTTQQQAAPTTVSGPIPQPHAATAGVPSAAAAAVPAPPVKPVVDLTF